MGKHIRNTILILTLCLLLCGCGTKDKPADTTTPTPAPTVEVTPTPTPAPTPVPVSEPLELALPASLTDDNYHTTVSGYLVIRAEDTPIGSLYFKWNKLPGKWTMRVDGETITAGENGFLHEYIELPAPATEIVLSAPKPLCEVMAFAPDANLPEYVQVWQPPLEQADMLLMPTHGDDEHVFFGGMMPYYAGQLGKRVQVVYQTSHWNEYLRPHEQLDGLWHVGIRNYPIMANFYDLWADDLKDAQGKYDVNAVKAWQVEMIRRFKPTVIIGHDLNGEYGHGVHILNATCLTETVNLAADAGAYPKSAEQYGVWDTPKLYLHLYDQNPLVMDWYQPLDRFGGKTAFQMAQEGFSKHASQVEYFEVYGAGHEYDCGRFGLYRSLVGPDVIGGDVFENIQ